MSSSLTGSKSFEVTGRVQVRRSFTVLSLNLDRKERSDHKKVVRGVRRVKWIEGDPTETSLVGSHPPNTVSVRGLQDK